MEAGFDVIIDGDKIAGRAGESALAAMQRAGRTHIPVGCRGGGCGWCVVRVVCGEYMTKKMSRKFISPQDEAAGKVLACRVYPTGRLEIQRDPE